MTRRYSAPFDHRRVFGIAACSAAEQPVGVTDVAERSVGGDADPTAAMTALVASAIGGTVEDINLGDLGRNGGRINGRQSVDPFAANATDMPKLKEGLRSGRVVRIGDKLSSVDLFLRVNAQRLGVAQFLHENLSGLRDDQPGGGSLSVVLRHQRLSALIAHTFHSRAAHLIIVRSAKMRVASFFNILFSHELT